MTTTLNERAFAFAQDLIKNGQVVRDQRDDWSEHQPSTRQENEFIEAHGWDEFSNWHLGIDDEASEDTKARYKFPMATSRGCTAAGCLPQKCELRGSSTRTSRMRPSGCGT